MANVKISQLPSYTGNTSGSWLVMNNSGETTTYKVQKETFLSGFQPSGDYATTGSNTFKGNQTISGSVTISGSAAGVGNGLNVIGNTQLSGSLTIHGSSAAGPKYLFFASASGSAGGIISYQPSGELSIIQSDTGSCRLFLGNPSGSNTIYGNTSITGSVNVTGSLFVSNSLSVDNNGNIRNTNPNGVIISPNFSGSTFSNVNGQMYIGTLLTGSAGRIRIEPGGEDGELKISARTTTITGSLNVTGGITGSLQGTASYATNALSASWAPTVVVGGGINTGSIATTQSITGSLIISGSLTSTGSIAANVRTLSISSNTASLNLNDASFFRLNLPNPEATTFVNPSNIKPGQTVNILVNNTSGGQSSNVVFPSSVKQVSGSLYTPSAYSTDILTLISFDSSSLYLASIKNLI